MSEMHYGALPEKVLRLLDMLEDELQKARNMPMTGKQLVDAASCLDIIHNIRGGLPDAIKRATNIVAEADSILKDARDNAASIVAEARQHAEDVLRDADAEADRLGSEHEITQRAHAQADDIIDDANETARNMVGRAENHSAQVHAATLNYLDTAMNTLHDSLMEHMRLVGNEIDGMRDNRDRLLRAAPESFHERAGSDDAR